MRNIYFFLACVILIVGIAIKSTADFNEGYFINTQIEEPSGIVYHPERNSLFVVDDDGILFELTTEGLILRSANLGDYDLEGVTLGDSPDHLFLAAEGIEYVLEVSIHSLNVVREIPVNRIWEGQIILYPDDEYGIEGILNLRGKILLLNQSFNIDPNMPPFADPSMLFEVSEGQGEYQISNITYFPFPDLSGIAEKGGLFYIVSGDEDLLLIYDPNTNEVIDQRWLPVGGDQEGIAFDNTGFVYIAVDGRGVFKTIITNPSPPSP